MFVKSFVKCRRALEEPRLGRHERLDVAVVVREQRLGGLHGAGAGSSQRELGALVCHLPLQARDLGVQRLGSLGRLRGGGHLALELGDLRVLCGEGLAPLVRAAYRFRLVRLGVLARLRLRRVALLLLLAFRLRGILLTVHVGHPFLTGGHEKCPHLTGRGTLSGDVTSGRPRFRGPGRINSGD